MTDAPQLADFCKNLQDLQNLRTTTPAPTTAPSSGRLSMIFDFGS